MQTTLQKKIFENKYTMSGVLFPNCAMSILGVIVILKTNRG